MCEPIRVLHMIGGLDLGGSQAFVMNVYRKINRELVQFDFILDHPSERYLEKEILSLGGKIFELPAFTGKNALTVRMKWSQFLDAHKEYRILHSHIRSYASIYLPIAKRKGLKTIIHSHSISNGIGVTSLVKSVMQFPLRFQADYFFACSPEAGEWLFGKRICSTDRFRVLKNAIDVQKYIFDNNKRTAIRSEFELKKDEFVLGFIGRVTEPKNPLFIINVFYEVAKINDNVKLLLVGDGNLIGEVKKKARQLEIEEKIIFAGTRNDTDALLASMDLFIFPSLWEGLGISLIEAQSSGLRCICSDRIPESAIITELVDVLSLEKGAQYWAERIVKMDSAYIRTNQFERIAEAGFEINNTVSYLETFYIKENGQVSRVYR